MDIFAISVVAILVCIVVYTNAQESKVFHTRSPKVCAPHEWRYHDEKGWLSEQDPDVEERLRHAILLCQKCKLAPGQVPTNYHGEY